MRKLILIQLIYLFLIVTATISHASDNYINLMLPTIEGASNIKNSFDGQFLTNSIEYNIQLKEPDTIHSFYDKYFEKNGWVNPTKNFPKSMKKKVWQSFHVNVTEENTPELLYASMWNTAEIPTIGTLRVKVTKFEKDIFTCHVNVAISPKVDTEAFFALQQFVMGDPKRIFAIHEKVGGNPLDITTIHLEDSNKYQNDAIMGEYYRYVSDILDSYKEFHNKFIK